MECATFLEEELHGFFRAVVDVMMVALALGFCFLVEFEV